MNYLIYGIVNLLLVGVFFYIMKKKDFLSFVYNGKWLLTALAIGIITLMDELTSIYYAPFEAFRFIGLKAIFYIALTSIFIRFLSTRMVEISEILEHHNIKGGGVYSFAYLVFGPTLSFIALSSILVDYILTATLSTVSAVENGSSFMHMGMEVKLVLNFAVVWGITFLNIMGIKENAKFTFYVFVVASIVLVNLLTGGFIHFDSHTTATLSRGFGEFLSDFNINSIFKSYTNVVIGIGSCILAYSGVESVMQTASLTKSWHEIKKAYTFLAFTVGIVTPLIALFALTSNVNISNHEADLIPAFATNINGYWFGVIVSILASFTLIMAVNTAMVASGELIEKIAHRYNFEWLISLNKRQSLFRIHLINGVFYTLILIVTNGQQKVLAEMYAVGLVASFTINIGSLLYYRYRKGTKDITYHTSRTFTLVIFFLLLSVLSYIIVHRPYGTLLWFIITMIILILGIRISKFRAPEIAVRKLSDNPMSFILALASVNSDEIHIHFKRPRENHFVDIPENHFFVSYYSPRVDTPEKMHSQHFQLSMQPRTKLFNMIEATLSMIQYEIPSNIKVHVHFGWPLSSWLDRLSVGVLIYNIIHIPRKFPDFYFRIDYLPNEHLKIKNNN